MRGVVAGAMVALATACVGASEPLQPETAADRRPATERPSRAAPPAVPEGTAIKLQTADGALLRGTMWPGPERIRGSEQPNGAVVFFHQLGSDRSEWAPYIAALTDRYTVVAVDLRGHGASVERIDGDKKDWSEFSRSDWGYLPNDVQAVLDYLAVVEPPGTPVALVGSSIGGSAALLHAASDPSVSRVAMLSPGVSYHGLDALAALARYGPRPILMLAAEGDHSSAMATRRLAELAENRTVKVYKGDGHGVAMEGPVLEDVLAFVRQMPTRLEQPEPEAAEPEAE